MARQKVETEVRSSHFHQQSNLNLRSLYSLNKIPGIRLPEIISSNYRDEKTAVIG